MKIPRTYEQLCKYIYEICIHNIDNAKFPQSFTNVKAMVMRDLKAAIIIHRMFNQHETATMLSRIEDLRLKTVSSHTKFLEETYDFNVFKYMNTPKSSRGKYGTEPR